MLDLKSQSHPPLPPLLLYFRLPGKEEGERGSPFFQGGRGRPPRTLLGSALLAQLGTVTAHCVTLVKGRLSSGPQFPISRVEVTPSLKEGGRMGKDLSQLVEYTEPFHSP